MDTSDRYLTLSDGNRMPRIGFGVFRMTDPAACEAAVAEAIEAGYRLIDTAAAYGRSVPQIVLRWLVQRGVVPVIKSANPERMRQNLAVFDFELSDDEMAAIAALDTGHTCFSPRDTGEAVRDFLEQAMDYDV